jgi:iron complex outermembrane receptor protein
LAANLNKTEVVGGIQNIPTILNQQQETYFYETYFSPKERSLIETNTPRSKVNFTVNYNLNKLSVMLRNIYWGEVTRDEFPFGTTQIHKGKVVTDLSLGYDIVKQLNLSVGVNNLLDKFPDQQVYENSYFGVFKYAPVQMGTMGRFYFARLTLKL